MSLAWRLCWGCAVLLSLVLAPHRLCPLRGCVFLQRAPIQVPLLPFPLYLLASTVFPAPSFHAQNQFGLMRTVAANKQMDGGS